MTCCVQAQEGDSDWVEELAAEEDDSTVEDSVSSLALVSALSKSMDYCWDYFTA